MDRDSRTHRAPRGLKEDDGSKTEYGLTNWCFGQVQSMYTRRGTPARWTLAGKLCTRCLVFWPESWLPQ